MSIYDLRWTQRGLADVIPEALAKALRDCERVVFKEAVGVVLAQVRAAASKTTQPVRMPRAEHPPRASESSRHSEPCGARRALPRMHMRQRGAAEPALIISVLWVLWYRRVGRTTHPCFERVSLPHRSFTTTTSLMAVALNSHARNGLV
jgi:hypothetical protein